MNYLGQAARKASSQNMQGGGRVEEHAPRAVTGLLKKKMFDSAKTQYRMLKSLIF